METNEYKVSALRFRPQKFSEVISQEFVTQTLMNAIISKKIAHSYLLSGPRGTGKTTIARIFAKALNCKNLKDGEPCDNCENCEEIKRGVHPDVFELDAASNRSIDDVRAIQDAAKYYPVKADYKFFIVDEVHMLTTQAFNAMLKILEEPPEYLIFILATTNPEKIPATILSRCQRFGLHRFKINEITMQLKKVAKSDNINIDEESLFLIAKLGDGALRDALGILDLAISYCGENITFSELKKFLNLPEKDVFFTISDCIYKGDTKTILEFVSDLLDKGFDMQTFYHGLTEHFRNLLIIKSTSDVNLLDESDFIRGRYKDSAENFTEAQLLRLLKILFEGENRYKYSSNQMILMETMLVELCRINKEIIDLETLISELEAIKKNSGSTSSGETSAPITIKLAEEPVRAKPKTDSEHIKKLKDLFGNDLEEHHFNQ